MAEITITDIEEFRSNAAVAGDHTSAAICSVALGDNGEDITKAYPRANWPGVNDLYQEDAWDLAEKWVREAQEMNK